MDILRHEGMNVRRPIVAPFGVAELLSTYPNMPQDYILVDIGSNITTVSLIGANQLYASRFFEWGGDNITDRIVEAFNINESEAERIKITYGIEKRQYSFHVPVCIKDNGDGNPIKHYSEELNYVIKKELDTFQNQLNNAINEIFNLNDPNLKSVPMILIGGGSLLNGLVDYLEPKVPSEFVKVVTPTSLGARNPTFFNCLGMLYVNSKYPLTFDEGQTKVGQVTRESK
jgi:cell division ATPase FtsA